MFARFLSEFVQYNTQEDQLELLEKNLKRKKEKQAQ